MQNYKDFVTSFVRQWNYTRSETLEILNILDDQKLQFKPGASKWQTLYSQFGCIARTQMVYARAIEEGKMDYGWFHEPSLFSKSAFQTKSEILKLLDRADKGWIEAIRKKREDEKFKISWPGFNFSLPNHITALISHERLHHGQILSYFTLAGFELPPKFKNNWSL